MKSEDRSVEAEAKEFIKSFVKEINTQDNRMTASPYFYVIRTAKYVASYHDGEGDRVALVGCEGVEYTGETEEEIIEQFKENYTEHYGDEDISKLDEWEVKGLIEKHELSFYWENKTWEEHGCFFTETDAEEHLRLNHYHYSKDAHTYVKHCWRAPQMKKLFESLNTLFKVEANTESLSTDEVDAKK